MGEGYFREIVESLGAAVLIVDDETRTIIDSNPTAQTLLGSSRDGLAGRSCRDLLCNAPAPRTPPCGDPGWGGRTETLLTTGSGVRIPVQMSVTPFVFEGRDYRIHCCVDITDKVDAEEALARANEQLKFWLLQGEIRNRDITLLNELAEAVQSSHALDEALRDVELKLPALFPGSSGSLGLLRGDGGTVRTALTWGGAAPVEFPPAGCAALRRDGPHMAGDGIAGEECPQAPSVTAAISLCIPLRSDDEPFGVIHLSFPPNAAQELRDTGKTPEAVRKLAVAVAGQTGLALSNIRLREKLRLQAVRDPLTGIFNRRYMEETLRREICRARRLNNTIGIVAVRIDRFAAFNDRHGRGAGDAVLKRMGKFLAARIRGGDIPCRYDGGEFVLVLSDATVDETVKRAEQIRREAEVAGAEFRGKPVPPVTLSFGVAAYPQDGETAEELLRAAGAALGADEAEGRQGVGAAPPPPVG